MKSDAMQRVIADYYNKTLKRRGQVDVFSIVKFRPKTNGTVNTKEAGLPDSIKTDQAWIGETPVGDWFYQPGFDYPPKSMILNIIEAISRDGNVAINIASLPDGTLDQGSTQMLKEVGKWMNVNGEAVYGSKAWSVLGEGENGVRKLPGGRLDLRQSEFPFNAQDFRFTVGKNQLLYAFCITIPAPGTHLKIKSLNTKENRLGHSVKSVKLLGYSDAIKWEQDPDGLSIIYPDSADLNQSAVFQIE